MLRYGITAGLMSAAFGLGLYVSSRHAADARCAPRIGGDRRLDGRMPPRHGQLAFWTDVVLILWHEGNTIARWRQSP